MQIKFFYHVLYALLFFLYVFVKFTGVFQLNILYSVLVKEIDILTFHYCPCVYIDRDPIVWVEWKENGVLKI